MKNKSAMKIPSKTVNTEAMVMKLIIAFFLSLLLSLQPSLAETTGTINSSGNTIKNITSVTGLLGYTVLYCDSDVDCSGYKCFVDFDGEVDDSVTSLPSGWCNATSITNCYNDGSPTATGSDLCVSNTTYRTCTSGAWGNTTSCASGQTCSGGKCSTASSTGGGGTGTSSNATTTANITLKITGTPTIDLSIVQGSSENLTIDVKNIGNTPTRNVTLSVSGITLASVSPSMHSILNAGSSVKFNITISVPSDTAVGTYTVTLNAASTNATATASFTLKVLPSAQTSVGINQTYQNYVTIVAGLNANLTALENQGALKSDVEKIKSLLSSAESKIKQANQSIASNDYFTANSLLADAASLIDEARNKMKNIGFETIKPSDTTFILIIAVVAIAILAFIAYLFWPSKEQTFTSFKT